MQQRMRLDACVTWTYAGGGVVIFSKQSAYLLDDCNAMMVPCPVVLACNGSTTSSGRVCWHVPLACKVLSSDWGCLGACRSGCRPSPRSSLQTRRCTCTKLGSGVHAPVSPEGCGSSQRAPVPPSLWPGVMHAIRGRTFTEGHVLIGSK